MTPGKGAAAQLRDSAALWEFLAMVPKFVSHEISLQGSWTRFGTRAGRGAVIPGLEVDFLLNSADRGNKGH